MSVKEGKFEGHTYGEYSNTIYIREINKHIFQTIDNSKQYT